MTHRAGESGPCEFAARSELAASPEPPSTFEAPRRPEVGGALVHAGHWLKPRSAPSPPVRRSSSSRKRTPSRARYGVGAQSPPPPPATLVSPPSSTSSSSQWRSPSSACVNVDVESCRVSQKQQARAANSETDRDSAGGEQRVEAPRRVWKWWWWWWRGGRRCEKTGVSAVAVSVPRRCAQPWPRNACRGGTSVGWLPAGPRAAPILWISSR